MSFRPKSKIKLSARCGRFVRRVKARWSTLEPCFKKGRDSVLTCSFRMDSMVVAPVVLNDLEYLLCFSGGEEDPEKFITIL